jgi:hypothetical protein
MPMNEAELDKIRKLFLGREIRAVAGLSKACRVKGWDSREVFIVGTGYEGSRWSASFDDYAYDTSMLSDTFDTLDDLIADLRSRRAWKWLRGGKLLQLRHGHQSQRQLPVRHNRIR